MTNESREAFETWAVDQPRVIAEENCFARSPYGAKEYEFSAVESLWQSWQAALQWAASQQAAPEGWRLVPAEPTKEMERAAFDELELSGAATETGTAMRNRFYRAMLAAAPTAQGERDEQ